MKPWQHKYFNECEQCGRRFNPNRRLQRFCSRKCAVRGRRGPRARASADKYNIQCEYCGRPAYRKPYLLAKNKFCFCSVRCANLYKRERYAGVKNPNYQSVPPKKCLECGTQFFSYASTRKYCSPKCAAKSAPGKSRANAHIGSLYERKCAAILKQNGALAILSAASRGPYDVIGLTCSSIHLIQVKFSRSAQVNISAQLDKLRDAPAPPEAIKQLWVFSKATEHPKIYEA